MDTTHVHDHSEEALLADVAAGHSTAFDRLYGLYAQRIFQYIRTFVSDTTLAEEVVGDTMMAVWRGAGTFSRTSRVSTWIFGIARHKALDAIRRIGKHQRDIELDQVAEMPHTGASPIDEVQRSQTAALTQQALRGLSRDHQEILRLVFYEELPYDEIAALLAIPENTVKTRVYYAKQQLKQQFDRLGQKESLR